MKRGQPESQHRPLLITALGMMGMGSGLIAGLTWWVYPTLWTQWLWFAGWVTATSGLALLGLLFLHALRSPGPSGPAPEVLLRQGLQIGALAGLLLWFQWGRLLAWPLVLMSLVTFLALEGVWQAWGSLGDGASLLPNGPEPPESPPSTTPAEIPSSDQPS